MVVGRRGGIQVRESRWSGILGSSPRDRSTRRPSCREFDSPLLLLLLLLLLLSLVTFRRVFTRALGPKVSKVSRSPCVSWRSPKCRSTIPFESDSTRRSWTERFAARPACPRFSTERTYDADRPIVPRRIMRRSSSVGSSFALFLALPLLVGSAVAALNPEGTKCGEKRCSTVEYCSPYDKHCKPCSNICDANGRNYQPNECVSDCQEYLHDKRYVLLKQYEDLRGEVGRLWILATVSIAVALLSSLSAFYLIAQRFPRWEKMRTAVSRTFTGRRRTSRGNAGNKSNNNNNNNNNKTTQQDAELGTSKHNGLKLPMPTISASVAPSRCAEKEAGHGNGNCSASGSGSGIGIGIGIGMGTVSGSGSGSGTGIGNATPNTTSTSLSRRHPSEDTTLDYAYDNPAMTPSPESVQLRTKRESSF